MKQKPTQVLKEEHKVIKKMLDVIEKIVSDFKEVDKNELESIVDFIKNFADKCHHAKEENKLFPAMEKAGIPKEDGPIGVMLQEHDIGRGYVRGLAETIQKSKKDKISTKDIKEDALGYVDLLRQHIDKEDNILYMMADMHINDNEQKNLVLEFEKVEERIGKGVHEKYHKLVESLVSKYSL
ncbi:MAG: hemerythrin domain-containing protein [Candidatus Omnitrophica bacterium]|nr:hemerythrin domain-containing protein [Candidatus Omnitrophota bacterium]